MELTVEKGIVIDNLENVGIAIEDITGKKIYDLEIVKKFVCHEKATKFYIDSKLNSKMVRDEDAVLLWIDTGYTDMSGNPIFISLHRGGGGFSGHITGTLHTLVKSLKERYPKNRKYIDTNYSKFLNKYRTKIEERETKHIVDEKGYYVSTCNSMNVGENGTILGKLIKNLDIEFAEEEVVVEEVVEEVQEAAPYEFDAKQHEITISYLLDEIEKAQALIREQWIVIKSLEADKLDITNDSSEKELQYKEKISELELKVKEREKAMVQMRVFGMGEIDRMKKSEEDIDEEMFGHNVLGHNKKLLVFGATKIDTNTMLAVLVKEFGYEKNDIDFMTDYTKIKSFGSSISSKYDAVIVGACPHSVKKKGNWTSAVDKILADEFIPAVADARLKNSTLGVSKDSFRNAIRTVTLKLKENSSD